MIFHIVICVMMKLPVYVVGFLIKKFIPRGCSVTDSRILLN